MFNPFQLLRKYVRYYFISYNGKGHGMHSPFVYDLIIHVLNDRKVYADYAKVEAARKRLRQDQRTLMVEDMGAGSMKNNQGKRSVADIARHAAKPAKYGQLLYRMVKYYQPKGILELGTSLGITTRYLSLAKPSATLVTMEGAAAIASVAEEGMRQDGLDNVRLHRGNFDTELPVVLKTFKPDFIFVDGNHRMKPTVEYFEQLLRVADNDTIIVFDDIHWSEEMEQAWSYIADHPAVRCSIDLFFIGIVLFRQEFREKQHFTIRF
ncbi:class I SAM-dependent methyltransferase [Terrimonas sp. NA20]|uniref:Class I SAM-dependent methyltransferase n=1 Tax=Terrimonas ginsenosidimutans TaxID=2908004 RepID=A0ABS9KY62_9BACT|nr:class I SAM-dependent methyltransferase [Terrimonas ginsenosidimutans]